MAEQGRYYSVAGIRAANAAAGFHFFDRDSMRAFSSRVHGRLYGGRYFVTSEQDRAPYGAAAWDGERRYTVREARADGSIGTVGEFGAFSSGAEAHRAAAELAEEQDQ